MCERVVFIRRDSAPRRGTGVVRRFARGEDGAATVEFVVMAGLVAAVSAVVLLNLSSGTSDAANGIGDDLARGGAIQIAASDPRPDSAGSGGRTWRNVPGPSNGDAGSGRPAGSAASGTPPSPVASDPGEGAGAAQGGTEPPAPSGGAQEAPAEQSVAAVPTAPANATATPREGTTGNGARPANAGGKGNGGKSGDDDEDDEESDDDRDEDEDDRIASCGLGKGNASATGNGNANGRAHRTPASNC
jgi:Flp pilus assembly pilin Flp